MNNNNNSKIHKHLNYISKSHQKIFQKNNRKIYYIFLKSPRYSLQHNVDSFLEILRGIAKFNGRFKIFEKELKEEEYQNIINYLKIHYKELRDEKDSNILSNKMPQNLILNKNENINIKLPTESHTSINVLPSSRILESILIISLYL